MDRRPVPGRVTGTVATFAVAALALAASACGGGSAGSEEQADPAVAKVTVTGDSISVGLGASLREAVGPGTEVKVIGMGGTGLARADVFDWPARLRQLAREFPPDVVVFSVGSNDAQDVLDPAGRRVAALADDAAWEDAYRERLAASFDAFEGTGTRVVWVGHVRGANDRVGLVNRRIHRLASEVAAGRDGVEVQDLAELLGSGEQVATDCLVPDGLHLTVDCLDRAAAQLVDRIGAAPPG